ncbi:unnamed protein product, partial [Prorocentrum cordatum]
VKEKPLELAFRAAAAHNETQWALGPEATRWSSKMSRRARAMRRDVDQALLKAKGGPKPSWLVNFTEVSFLDSDGPEQTAAAPAAASGAGPAVNASDYRCKLNRDEQVVYRVAIGSTKPCAREASKPLKMDESKDADDSVIAYWNDGMQWEVPNLTHGMLATWAANEASHRPVHYTVETKEGSSWKLFEYQDGRDGSSLKLKGKNAPPFQLIITRHSSDEKAAAIKGMTAIIKQMAKGNMTKEQAERAKAPFVKAAPKAKAK